MLLSPSRTNPRQVRWVGGLAGPSLPSLYSRLPERVSGAGSLGRGGGYHRAKAVQGGQGPQEGRPNAAAGLGPTGHFLR